uniref:Uncharacterized protein n=1 Tax=Oryza sativa subsp. japonica TaxID=39947 RepID=Q6K600_ORYSJ|nr:hypothetical protein [Oryza sativa Japonica Group]
MAQAWAREMAHASHSSTMARAPTCRRAASGIEAHRNRTRGGGQRLGRRRLGRSGSRQWEDKGNGGGDPRCRSSSSSSRLPAQSLTARGVVVGDKATGAGGDEEAAGEDRGGGAGEGRGVVLLVCAASLHYSTAVSSSLAAPKKLRWPPPLRFCCATMAVAAPVLLRHDGRRCSTRPCAVAIVGGPRRCATASPPRQSWAGRSLSLPSRPPAEWEERERLRERERGRRK